MENPEADPSEQDVVDEYDGYFDERSLGIELRTVPWEKNVEDSQDSQGVEEFQSMEESKGTLKITFTLDGKFFGGFPVSLSNLVRSAIYPGEYDIFTCTCGHGGCTGIFDGIIVIHCIIEQSVRWLVPPPVSNIVSASIPRATVYTTIFLGPLATYRATILDACDRAINLISNHEFPLEFYVSGDGRDIHKLRESLASVQVFEKAKLAYDYTYDV